jgi:Uma2 family endonuclease
MDGQILAMAGATKAHVIIVGNLSALILNHLRGTSCISYATDMKVRLPASRLFYYPDLAVTCNESDKNSDEDFILHPKLLIEVLSDSTEASLPSAHAKRVRGDKFADYKTIPEFEEYLLVHQNQILVEQFQRRSNNLWVPTIYSTGDTLQLKSMGFSCSIAALYQNLAQLI